MDVSKERFEKGKVVREKVLGPAHVARTSKNRTPFNADFQDFLDGIFVGRDLVAARPRP